MKSEQVTLEIPQKLIQIAENEGMDKEKIKQMMQSLAILELGALTSKIRDKDIESLSKIIKDSAWKKTKNKLKI